jgi:hypothetical protein
MAQSVIVRLTDDFDGTTAADETVQFSVDGRAFVIDLSTDHAKVFRDVLDPYIQHGRPVTAARKAHSATRSGGTTPRHGDPAENRRIRDWADRNGILLSKRGRIPENVIGQYRQEHGAIV